MHHNYYFLRQLTPVLSDQLVGTELAVCFSQDKDELVLGFVAGKRECYVKAVLRPDLACLVFPEDFQRARRNSVDLFGELIGLRVREVIQYLNERAFSLVFDGGFTLLFKLHGNRANLVLFRADDVVALFHHHLVGDHHLRLAELHRPIVQTYAAFRQAGCQVAKLFPTFGKLPTRYLREKDFDSLGPEAQWSLVEEVVAQLEQPVFYLVRLDGEIKLSLLALGEIESETRDPWRAANDFYHLHTRLHSLEDEKAEALRTLNKRKGQTENYLLKNYGRREELENQTRNEQLAHILMANLHQIPPRSETVELLDFYRNQPVRIKIKPDLSAQRNAEVYYRKAKNEKIEINRLRQNATAKEEELQRIEAHVRALEPMDRVKEIRKYVKENGLTNDKAPETPAELFKHFEHEGFGIWVGRNAKNNDLLTQKYAFKEDLWLHARDVSGSHVLIKYQSGKPFPQTVIEKAAQLAAWFSKRRHEGFCPVIVTPKKFVRKPKGLPEGAVVVDKEEVRMVVPENWAGRPSAAEKEGKENGEDRRPPKGKPPRGPEEKQA
ncbi:MAG: DUF814 domain-containing protein [Ferruginibacter sp.]|nr:DUF814 domain-containing protein [Cytophagales bacterium]